VILDGQKPRLMMMLAVNAACFVLAGVAALVAAAFGLTWLAPVVVAFIGAGVGAMTWFVVGWAKTARAGEGRLQA
jgi:hypothetical protein